MTGDAHTMHDHTTPPPRVTRDHCTLPLVWRLAAMLDRDPLALRDGDPLPRGWHPLLFNAPTRQSMLRADGAGDLGVTLPDLGLPRLMLGGRQTDYFGDIPIGARVRRETRLGSVQPKSGRSGRFAIVRVVHRIFVEDAADAVLEERQDYILREAGGATGAANAPPAAAVAATDSATAPGARRRVLVPDEPLLFRYSSITDNPHRIHYDAPYARGVEGYPALVVNGSIPAMFLLEMFREAAGREPCAVESRNVAPMYCGVPLTLDVQPQDGDTWSMRASDPAGATTFEASVR